MFQSAYVRETLLDTTVRDACLCLITNPMPLELLVKHVSVITILKAALIMLPKDMECVLTAQIILMEITVNSVKGHFIAIQQFP